MPKCIHFSQNRQKCIHIGKNHENGSILNYSLSITFWAINLIFNSGKRWDSIFFDDKSFLPPQKFFTPLFEDWKSENFVIWKIGPLKFRCKKGGKKLLSGVKNFFVKLSQLSTFFWIKNHPHNSKTHFCSSHGVKITWGVSSGWSPLRKTRYDVILIIIWRSTKV